MKCVGCGSELPEAQVAAYALMHESDLAGLKAKDVVKGPGVFHAAPCCKECFVDPAHRKHVLKAHFAMPEQMSGMVGLAGSSGKIG